MGTCQSSTAATDSVGINNKSIKTQGTGRTVKCVVGGGSDSDVDSHIAPHSHQQPEHSASYIPEQVEEVPVSFEASTGMLRKEALKDDAEHKSEQFKNRPGYSSGGSSFLESSDEETSAVRSYTRHEKLCEWKQELMNNGDLTSKIVRIEVRSTKCLLCPACSRHLCGLLTLFGMYVRPILDETLKMYTKECTTARFLEKE